MASAAVVQSCASPRLSVSDLLSQGITAQALPSVFGSQTSFITGVVQGSQAMNQYTDLEMHRNNYFPLDETPFASGINCPSGVVSVNNSCVCPGASTAVPFRMQPGEYTNKFMDQLFTPGNEGPTPGITAVAAALIAQRSPGGVYVPLDAPLPPALANASCGAGVPPSSQMLSISGNLPRTYYGYK